MTRVLLISLHLLVVNSLSSSSHADEYINRYKEIAISEMQRTGIPASIKLAQGLLESNWGRSELARKANNHFGIKCGGKWNGDGFYIEDDDRDKKGKIIPSCFRVFDSAMESYIAHSEFLTTEDKVGRYSFLFQYSSNDYKSWARGLKKAGYATDRKYSGKLINIIERYELYEYDFYSPEDQNGKIIASVSESKNKPKSSRLRKSSQNQSYRSGNYDFSTINGVRMTTAIGGETLEELALRTGADVEELMKHNEEFGYRTKLMEPGEIVFFSRKKRSYKGEVEFHAMADGETMFEIAQKYGIKLANLYAKNKMPKGAEPLPGQNIYVSKTAPKGKRPAYTKHPRRNQDTEFLFAIE
ncbi:MAG: LysM peptidoglycan-binding domain-containing protein [Saprospiraceae bacterium]|nr:LysM peptidoglycan-binding domain-containing protein [Saprospiraceae bacterium]